MNAEEIIENVLTSVRRSHKMLAGKGMAATPQAIPAALLTELRKIDPAVDKRDLDEVLDEMNDRGWIIQKGKDLIIFDEGILI